MSMVGHAAERLYERDQLISDLKYKVAWFRETLKDRDRWGRKKVAELDAANEQIRTLECLTAALEDACEVLKSEAWDRGDELAKLKLLNAQLNHVIVTGRWQPPAFSPDEK